MSSTVTTISGHTFAKRDLRAATEDIAIEKLAPAMYVANGEYNLDLEQLACLCPDFQYRHNRCKHLRKAQMIEGKRPIPDVPGLDEDLRELVDESDAESEDVDVVEPDVPLPDGGVQAVETPSQNEELEATGESVNIHRIVCQVTSTIEDLPDFSYDPDNPADRGEPYRSLVAFATDTVERLIEAETEPERDHGDY